MLTQLLRRQLAAHRRDLAAVGVLQLVQTLAALALPSINADIINDGVMKGDTGFVWRHGGLMLLVALVQITFNIGAVYFGARAAAGFGRDVRAALFERVTAFSSREVAAIGAPSLITRITNDVQQVQMVVLLAATLAVAAPITMVGGLIMALREDVGLSAVLAFAVPTLTIVVALIVSRMVPQFRLMQDRIDSINRIMREQITGIRVVRAFVRERDEAKRFAGANDDLTDTSLHAGHLMAFMFPTILVVLNASSVLAVWIGAHRIADGAIQPGTLLAFLTYLVQILMSVMMATFLAIMIPRAAVCAERIEEVLHTDPSIRATAHPVTELAGPPTLEFRNVSFAYPGAESPVLHDVSFTLTAGDTLAVVGSTGSGKTTLVNLIARLVDVTAGEVALNGVDVREIDPELLWSRIGLVPQKPFLFSGTVGSNLRFADPDATDEQVQEALRIAQAESFVAAMPGGLDAPITQGGTNVSGGQRQRLAIARALVRNPAIFLFDDSFSALDLATDARLRAALAPRVSNAITVIVAQRISTISGANHILVLDDGDVMGLGTHDELIANCPTYVEIIGSQATETAA